MSESGANLVYIYTPRSRPTEIVGPTLIDRLIFVRDNHERIQHRMLTVSEKAMNMAEKLNRGAFYAGVAEHVLEEIETIVTERHATYSDVADAIAKHAPQIVKTLGLASTTFKAHKPPVKRGRTPAMQK